MSVEISIHIFNNLKIPMIFAFAIKTSVKLYVFLQMSMEISIDIFLSSENIDDIQQNDGGKFHRYFTSISKMSMEISIDILLLSVNQIRICKVFSQIFRLINFQKMNSFYSNALLLVKIQSFKGFFDNTMGENVKICVRLTDFTHICHSVVKLNTTRAKFAMRKHKNRNLVKNKLKTAIFDRFPLFQNITFGFRTCQNQYRKSHDLEYNS